MTLLVPVKAAATVDEEFELTDDGLDIDPDFLELELNEWDSYSIEAALALCEAGDADDVVLVTVGDEEAEGALRAGLAMGAQRAIRVSPDGLPGLVGPLLTARLLAAVAVREAPDLILCGAQSSDAAWGATGVALAAALELPHVAVVRELSYHGGDRLLEVSRELEGGTVQRMRVAAPAVITVQTGLNQPRYANLRAIKQAQSKPLEVLSAADLGVEPDSVPEAVLRRVYVPDSDQAAAMLEGDAEAVAARIAAIVGEAMAR